MNTSAFRSFRVLVFEIAEKLTYSDCETLRFIYSLPEKDHETGAARLEVLRTLHRQGVFTDAQGLSEVLRTAHREDLAKEVDESSRSPRPSSCSPVTSERDWVMAQNSPTQLRGMCDANTAQANSLAAELGSVRESIPSSGLSRESLERLQRELVEVEQALQVMLGRCEMMKTCCSFRGTMTTEMSGDLATDQRKSLTLRPIPAPRRKGNSLGSSVRFSSGGEPAEGRRLCSTMPHHIRSSSCDDILVQHIPTPAAAGASGGGSFGGGCGGVYGQQYRTHHHYHRYQSSLVTSSSSETEVHFMTRSSSNERPRVPKKPAWMKRSRSVDGLDEGSSFPDQSHPHTPSLSDSGYSGSGSPVPPSNKH